jgi:Icc-related predicted phosphoesterase
MRPKIIGRRLSPRASTTLDPDSGEVRLFYASDPHGSVQLWKKFLRAGEFYGASVLVLGGDLAGKAFVPIVRRQEDGRWQARLFGRDHVVSDGEIDELEASIRLNGMYPYRTTSDQLELLSTDVALQAATFDAILKSELRMWCELADARLNGNTQALVMCGNDDPLNLDGILRESKRLIWCDDQLLKVGGHEVISLSYANRTPWNSPRELDEDELYARIARLADQLEHKRSAIFNLHVPPFNSGLDSAPRLTEDLQPVLVGGAPEQVPVGSTAVREAIETYQPLLSMHGHIHESRGKTEIGRTVVVNPGSEYNTGRLHGCLVRLTQEAVTGCQLVMG